MSMEQADKLAIVAKVQWIANEELLAAKNRADEWSQEIEFRVALGEALVKDAERKAATRDELDKIMEDVKAGKL